jgi:hypothetical protein
MAAETGRSGRSFGVVGVRSRRVAGLFVARRTRVVALASGSELVIRIALVHGVTGETRDLVLGFAAEITGREDHPVVFATADANTAVSVEEVVDVGAEHGHLWVASTEPLCSQKNAIGT